MGVWFAILAANIIPTTLNVLAHVIWLFDIVPSVVNIILWLVEDEGVLNIVVDVVNNVLCNVDDEGVLI